MVVVICVLRIVIPRQAIVREGGGFSLAVLPRLLYAMETGERLSPIKGS